MTSKPLIQSTFIFKTSIVAIFADIIKIVIMFIKTVLKAHKKLKQLEIMY